MALDVENLHSVVHHKSEVSAALQYALTFGSTAKESPKRTTAWSAYYYTSRGSGYPVPERSLGPFEIPSMIDVTNLSGQGFQRRNLHDEGVSKSWTLPLGLFRTNFTNFPIG